ncbi:MAG: signal recognition particle protein [Armatimonadetes bacterium]|nr:signal recognition particle protein [Armatimonadota bacterium]
MFESLTENLKDAFRRLGSKGRVGEADLRRGLKEIRTALLDADVNYQVVKTFERRVRDQALGADVLKGLNPAQQLFKITHDELLHLLGEKAVPIKLAKQRPTIVLLCGLQGSGKTTMAGKLGRRAKRDGLKPLLAATDIYRPAAIQQLQIVGEQAGVDVFQMGQNNPVDIAKAAVSHARSAAHDLVIIDTAGRLHIDEAMMDEAAAIEGAFEEVETLLVVDAMTGQDAVNVAEAFSQRLDIDGVVLTKLDSDARGGAALSVREVTGKPIKFVGTSEHLDGLDVFHPDRMAQRILGQGDILTLIERAQQTLDADQAAEVQRKLLEDEFDLEDFRQHLRNVRKMGPIDQILKMIPGAENMPGVIPTAEEGEAELDLVDAVICSMTANERRDPDILNGSRRRRIARGSGRSVQEVNIVIKQWKELREMMRGVAKGQPLQLGDLLMGRQKKVKTRRPF